MFRHRKNIAVHFYSNWLGSISNISDTDVENFTQRRRTELRFSKLFVTIRYLEKMSKVLSELYILEYTIFGESIFLTLQNARNLIDPRRINILRDRKIMRLKNRPRDKCLEEYWGARGFSSFSVSRIDRSSRRWGNDLLDRKMKTRAQVEISGRTRLYSVAGDTRPPLRRPLKYLTKFFAKYRRNGRNVSWRRYASCKTREGWLFLIWNWVSQTE